MDFDTRVRAAIYGWIVESSEAPAVDELTGTLGEPRAAIRDAYGRLFRKRVRAHSQLILHNLSYRTLSIRRTRLDSPPVRAEA